jgi:hypothetical protein
MEWRSRARLGTSRSSGRCRGRQRGTSEAAQGPAAAALANAIAHATGKRFCDLPLSPDRIKAVVWI